LSGTWSGPPYLKGCRLGFSLVNSNKIFVSDAKYTRLNKALSDNDMEDYFINPERAKENVEGPFYTIDIGRDCGCGLPEAEAPELIRMTKDRRYQSYFYKQPLTEIEIDHAIEAVNICQIHDIRYGGKDPGIIKRIESGQSDYIITKKGKVILNEKNT
jgi:hypothetical protein